MGRILRVGAGCALALLIITCTEQNVTGPQRSGAAALTFAGLAPRAGGARVPVNSLEIKLQRSTDQSTALDSVFGFRPDTAPGDSAVLRLNVNLRENPEDFVLSVRAFGSGATWYMGSSSTSA